MAWYLGNLPTWFLIALFEVILNILEGDSIFEQKLKWFSLPNFKAKGENIFEVAEAKVSYKSYQL